MTEGKDMNEEGIIGGRGTVTYVVKNLMETALDIQNILVVVHLKNGQAAVMHNDMMSTEFAHLSVLANIAAQQKAIGK